jgi:hypothetical protein
MKLIATQTLTSAGPSISFSSIPNNFTDLYVLLSLRMARSTTGGAVKMRINGSDTNFSWRSLQGNGSGVSNDSQTDSNLFWTDGANQTANTFGNIAIYIPNYAGSTNKSISVDAVDENNATESYQRITAGLWSNTAAITSLSWSDNSASDWVAGTTASLYGIGGAGDGWAPKATGGVISKIDGYYVHTFTASGTFTPTADLANVEYVVVAGGGGGGGDLGGGGGAGGYRSSVVGESSGGGTSAETRLSLSAGVAQTVTVGAGGVAGTPSTRGGLGVNSVFGSITSTGGGGGGKYDAGGGLLSNGTSGGSGGGGGLGDTGSTANGGAGTTNQGFAGGNGRTFSPFNSGGGGGAGSTGGNASPSSGSGFGGSGVSSSITGSSVARAGGGGGGAGGVGTAGGGSSITGAPATAGTVNTGGGGGGAVSGGTGTGAAGGSGIVIVRYAA